MSEFTFIILKPETVGRGLIGQIISRIEGKGFKIKAMKYLKASLSDAEKLYAVHVGKSFYPELIAHITSGPIVPMVVEAPDAVVGVRKLIGATDPQHAEPGTIRRDFGLSVTKNAIHAADSPENAVKEMSIFFSPQDIVE
ncbi:MAG: nucleoside-diphosphate kinase [Candidatus Bathyarchaeia archaeon]